MLVSVDKSACASEKERYRPGAASLTSAGAADTNTRQVSYSSVSSCTLSQVVILVCGSESEAPAYAAQSRKQRTRTVFMVINSNLDSPWGQKTVAVEWREGRVTRRSGPARRLPCSSICEQRVMFRCGLSDAVMTEGCAPLFYTRLNHSESCWWACPCWCARQHQVQQGVKVKVKVTSNVVHDMSRSSWHTSLSFLLLCFEKFMLMGSKLVEWYCRICTHRSSRITTFSAALTTPPTHIAVSWNLPDGWKSLCYFRAIAATACWTWHFKEFATTGSRCKRAGEINCKRQYCRHLGLIEHFKHLHPSKMLSITFDSWCDPFGRNPQHP